MTHFDFKRDRLYSMADVEKILAAVGIDKQTFLNNLGLGVTGRDRIFQNALFGHEVLRAMECKVDALRSCSQPVKSKTLSPITRGEVASSRRPGH